ncbi:uncharacterized protein LOC125847254 [Solanum stenotomum]|uniref:uncharacterized protein LOC125847254 n=1 Tax=Solanum stenotomum TaxID=172797 RepID=UPI0020D06588|nr:uncharacterized protein LOC125847254 [Solanum stenotomum]
MTVVANTKNVLVPQRPATGWRVCMDYRKLNKWTLKDHFPMSFMDQMLDRLDGKGWYCFLDGYSGYNNISIAPEDQEKTTFTCPYGTFEFKRMPFGLCNALATFLRCMMSIFSDMVEDTLEIFMDDFSMVGDTFDDCLLNLSRALQRCEEANLGLNWEKCHFMVKEGIVLGHKVSQKGLTLTKTKLRRFIKDFSKIAHPLCKILEKEVKFAFDEACLRAFECLKEKLISSPVIIGPDWAEPFEIMCDASEFDLEVEDRRGCENQVADHLSRLEAEKREKLELEINDSFPDKQVLAATLDLIPWFDDFANFLISDLMLEGLTFQQRKRFLHVVGKYFWDEPYLYRVCTDNIIRRCIPEVEMLHILEACHSSPVGGHHGGARTAQKVLQCGYYWPTIHQDAMDIIRCCDVCQRQKAISRHHELSMTPILEVELFNVWGVDFMGPFVGSYGQKYILVALDCVSKWVEAVVFPENDANNVVGFLKKNIFSRFGTPRAIISDDGSHFCNKVLKKLNISWSETTNLRLDQINEMNEFCLRAYKRLRLFPRKLRSKWSGPFRVTQVFQSGAIELDSDKGERFKANGQQIKAYLGVPEEVKIVEECKLDEVVTVLRCARRIWTENCRTECRPLFTSSPTGRGALHGQLQGPSSTAAKGGY